MNSSGMLLRFILAIGFAIGFAIGARSGYRRCGSSGRRIDLSEIGLDITVLEQASVKDARFALFLNNGRRDRLEHLKSTVAEHFKSTTFRMAQVTDSETDFDCLGKRFFLNDEDFAKAEDAIYEPNPTESLLLGAALIPERFAVPVLSPEDLGLIKAPLVRVVVMFGDHYVADERRIGFHLYQNNCQSRWPTPTQVQQLFSSINKMGLIFVTPNAATREKWRNDFPNHASRLYPSEETLQQSDVTYVKENDKMARFVKRKVVDLACEFFSHRTISLSEYRQVESERQESVRKA